MDYSKLVKIVDGSWNGQFVNGIQQFIVQEVVNRSKQVRPFDVIRFELDQAIEANPGLWDELCPDLPSDMVSGDARDVRVTAGADAPVYVWWPPLGMRTTKVNDDDAMVALEKYLKWRTRNSK